MYNSLRCSLSRVSDISFDFDIYNFNIKSYNDFLYGSGSNSIEDILSCYLNFSCENGIEVRYLKKRIEKPDFNVYDCIEKNISYSGKLYVTIEIVVSELQDGNRVFINSKEFEILLCEIPLMTEKGSFIINGIEKVVVSQIHRTPGLLFSKDSKNNKELYEATILPYNGSRIVLSVSNDDKIVFKVDKKKSISAYYLLYFVFGMENSEIVHSFYSKLDLKLVNDNMYSFEFDLLKAVGKFLSLDLRDENGNIVINSGSIIDKITARKMKNNNVFYIYCKDLLGCYVYDDFDCDNITIKSGSIIDDNVLLRIVKGKKKNISIVDLCSDFNNTSLLVDINEISAKSYESNFKTLMSVIRPNLPFDIENSKKHIEDLFFNTKKYNLRSAGRHKLNRILGLDIPMDCYVLTADDIVMSIKKLIDFKSGVYCPYDIDDLSNRRIRSVGEIVSNNFENSINNFVSSVSEKITAAVSVDIVGKDSFNTSNISAKIRDFFLLSDLCQFMEQNNVLSEISHTRRITALGEGGITRDRATSAIRDIHTTHYGKICPIETPDGGNIGLITNLACYANIDEYGFLVSPYRKVVDGKITDEIVYLDSDEEKKHKISFISKEFIYAKDDDIISARYNGDFMLVNKKMLEYVDVAPNQAISIVASCIPFLENNDTARALMGCNMQRQAVPLLFTSIPVVATGFERNIAKMFSSNVKSSINGVVKYVDAKCICVDNCDDKESGVNFYYLNNFRKTNHKTLDHQRPIVSVGDKVKAGDIIADCSSTKNGELALGQNLLVAFMPWNGYNYEDSVVISKKLLVDDSFTSVHIEEFEVQVRETSSGIEVLTNDVSGLDPEKKQMLDENGIIQIGSNVMPNDVLVGKVMPISSYSNTAEEKLLCAIFGETNISSKDSSFRVPNGIKGTVVGINILTRSGLEKCSAAKVIEREKLNRRVHMYEMEKELICQIYYEKLCKIKNIKNKLNFEGLKKELAGTELYNSFISICDKIDNQYHKDISDICNGDKLPNGVQMVIKISIAIKSKLQPGDKISGRHGNKGVISKCVAVEDMPYMEDGTPIDLVFSPVSVPGRMNIGQILEVHLGLLSYNIGRKIDEMLEKKVALDNIKKLLTDVSFDEKFNAQISNMGEKDIINTALMYRKGLFFKTPVFNGSAVDNFNLIADKLGIDKSLQVDLYDGMTGEKFDRKVTVGYMYIIKLHHFVDEKIHARSIGTYNLITQQPIGGRANFGGQRFGEMECWALQAYGAAYTLQEMLSIKSDDISGRNKVYSSIIDGYNFRFLSNTPESFNVMCREMNAIGIDVECGFNS